jgi:O-antigen ligase
VQRSKSGNDSPGAARSAAVPPSAGATLASALRRAARAIRGPARFAVAALAALPVWSYLGVEPVLAGRAIVVSVAALAAISPASGLLVCAGLVPLAGPLAALIGTTSEVGLTEPMVIACLAGWLLRAALRPGPPPDPRIRALVRPAVVLAVVVASSAIVELIALQPAVAYPGPFTLGAVRFLYTDFFRDRAQYGPVVDAAFLLEGVGAFVAVVTLAGRTRALGARILAMVACGAVGVSALSLVRLLTISVRSGDAWTEIVRQVPTIRISSAFPDLNAAGSYLAMGVFLAAGQALGATAPAEGAASARRGLAGLLWWLCALVVASGLWLTGSRMALVALAPAALLLLTASSRTSRKLVWALVTGIALVGGLSLLVVVGRSAPAHATNRASIQEAASFRAETMQAAVRMFVEQPVFGVGIGLFSRRSPEYFAPAFRNVVARENAHNNFLQVLAELGMVGFVPFVWTIAAVGWAVGTRWRSGRLPAAVVTGAAGLVAFLTTWMGGHPLLILEVATAFWLVLAAVAAMSVGDAANSARPRAVGSRLSRYAAVLLVVVAVASVPIRGTDAAHQASLKNAAIGFSAWDTDEQGIRFRRMTDRSGQIYISAAATAVRLPLRLDPSVPEAAADVEILLDGKLANRVRVHGSDWSGITILLPRTGPREGYRAVRFSVVTPESRTGDRAQPSLEIGTPSITEPRAR